MLLPLRLIRVVFSIRVLHVSTFPTRVVRLDVPRERRSPREGLVASDNSFRCLSGPFTDKWPSSFVCSSVPSQAAGVAKGFVAFPADVGLLPGVNTLMHC